MRRLAVFGSPSLPETYWPEVRGVLDFLHKGPGKPTQLIITGIQGPTRWAAAWADEHSIPWFLVRRETAKFMNPKARDECFVNDVLVQSDMVFVLTDGSPGLYESAIYKAIHLKLDILVLHHG